MTGDHRFRMQLLPLQDILVSVERMVALFQETVYLLRQGEGLGVGDTGGGVHLDVVVHFGSVLVDPEGESGVEDDRVRHSRR